MKKILLLTVLFIFVTVVHARGEVFIDLSEANIEVTGDNTFRVKHATVPGWSGSYWADFEWDPSAYTFKPVQYAEDPAPAMADKASFKRAYDDLVMALDANQVLGLTKLERIGYLNKRIGDLATQYSTAPVGDRPEIIRKMLFYIDKGWVIMLEGDAGFDEKYFSDILEDLKEHMQ
jgi:hypothetical protein